MPIPIDILATCLLSLTKKRVLEINVRVLIAVLFDICYSPPPNVGFANHVPFRILDIAFQQHGIEFRLHTETLLYSTPNYRVSPNCPVRMSMTDEILFNQTTIRNGIPAKLYVYYMYLSAHLLLGHFRVSVVVLLRRHSPNSVFVSF